MFWEMKVNKVWEMNSLIQTYFDNTAQKIKFSIKDFFSKCD